MNWTLVVDLVVLAGVGAVLPLALGSARAWWFVTGAVATAMLLSVGVGAALIALVWPVVAVVGALRAARTVGRSGQRVSHSTRGIGAVEDWVPPIAWALAAVAGGAFVAARAGWELFGIGDPIVELTAVHFTYAGVGALVLAGHAFDAGGRSRAAAVSLTVAAPPVVAVGFITHHPAPQVGGAVLMSIAVLMTATGQLRDGFRRLADRPRLLIASGIAPWIPMGLAVAWAASNYWVVPALSIPDMARTHGVANVWFVIVGLLARRGERVDAAIDVSPQPVAAVAA